MAYRILIVDDSPAMRAFVRRTVNLCGFDVAECLEAGNGREALELLGHEWVDVILTDINMPLMNGEELARALDGDEMLRTIPVVVVSTDSTSCRIRQMTSLGARGYLPKPFLPQELRAELDRILGEVHA